MSCRNGIACGSQAPMMGKSFTAAMEGSEIRFLRSGEEPVRLGDIHFGDDIEIWQGLDKVRYLHFERPAVSTEKLSETMVLQRLASCHGPMMPVPHSFGALANQMKEYPKIKYWLREMIRKSRCPVMPIGF